MDAGGGGARKTCLGTFWPITTHLAAQLGPFKNLGNASILGDYTSSPMLEIRGHGPMASHGCHTRFRNRSSLFVVMLCHFFSGGEGATAIFSRRWTGTPVSRVRSDLRVQWFWAAVQDVEWQAGPSLSVQPKPGPTADHRFHLPALAQSRLVVTIEGALICRVSPSGLFAVLYVARSALLPRLVGKLIGG